MNTMKKQRQLRRKKLFDQMKPGTMAVVRGATNCVRSADVCYPYRQNSTLYYLTGCVAPDAVAVFIRTEEKDEWVLFVHEKDPKKEQWDGPMLGVAGAKTRYGADQAFERTRFEALFSAFQKTWTLMDIEPVINEARLIKDPTECLVLQTAADITVKAHEAAMKACRPGGYEYQLEAALVHTFYYHGSRFPAYPAIVGAGDHACILHYTHNHGLLRSGDLVLIDAGAEYQYYACDVTRTFPVNGRFTSQQKDLYQVVLHAQCAAIEAIKPGVDWSVLTALAVGHITQGLLDLGLLKGRLDTLIESKAYQSFMPHRLGHWLGLDVHDVGGYQQGHQPRVFEPGMVMTIEPGIYIPQAMDHVAPSWRGMGVRIEDVVLVTETGGQVLTQGLTKTVDGIESLMAQVPPT